MTPAHIAAHEAGRRDWPHAHVVELRRLMASCQSWQSVAEGMQAVRPGVGHDACRMRAARLGASLGVRGALWSEAEDAALIDATERLTGWSAVAKHMQAIRPGASRDAVRERARRIGLCDDGEPWG